METPPVQYVTTSDGFDIAYTVSGEGPAFVVMPAHFNNVLGPWNPASGTRPWMEALSDRFHVIHYDSRGQGMSTRGLPQDHSIHDYERDLEAVIEDTVPGQFVLFAFLMFGHAAVRYAAKRPERVKALILLNCRVEGSSGPLPPLAELARNDWEGFLDVISRTITAAAKQAWAKSQFRDSVKQADYLLQTEAFAKSTIREVASTLRVPTLLLAVRATSWSFDAEAEARRFATLIPDARIVLFDGTDAGTLAPEGGTPPNVVAIDAFLAGIAERAPAKGPVSQGHVAGLSAREIEVLRLIVAGMSNDKIARDLVISIHTVGRHVSNIFAKTGAANRTEAAIYARDHGLA